MDLGMNMDLASPSSDVTQHYLASSQQLHPIEASLEQVRIVAKGLQHTLHSISQAPGYDPSGPMVRNLQDQLNSCISREAQLVSEMTSINPLFLGCPSNNSSRSTTPTISRPNSPITHSNTSSKRKDLDFQFPPLRKQSRRFLLDTPTNTLPLHNTYSCLENEAAGMSSTQPQQRVQTTPTPTQTTPPTQIMSKPILPPPVMLKITTNYREQLKTLTSHIPTLRNRLSGEFIKLYTNNDTEYRTLNNLLTQQNFEFYVIKPKLERPIKIVLKGLPRDTNTTDIHTDLTELGYTVEKVTQLIGRRTKMPMAVFLVTLPRTPNNTNIFTLTTLGYMSVRVEGYINKGITQCYSCNRFHHTSQNCSLKPRCLKCGENHQTKDCSIKQKIATPFCINCEVYGHMANWGGCPRYPKPRRDTNRNTNTYTSVINSIIRPNISYAQAAKNTTQNLNSNSNFRQQMAPQKTPRQYTKRLIPNTSAQPETINFNSFNPNNPNNLSNTLNLTIVALNQLSQALTSMPAVLNYLPQINAAKSDKNKMFALIEALLNEK